MPDTDQDEKYVRLTCMGHDDPHHPGPTTHHVHQVKAKLKPRVSHGDPVTDGSKRVSTVRSHPECSHHDMGMKRISKNIEPGDVRSLQEGPWPGIRRVGF